MGHPEQMTHTPPGSISAPRAELAFGCAALGAALFGGLVLPGNEVGLNFVLSFVGVLLATAIGRPNRVTLQTVGFAMASLALMSTTAVRDASWVVGVNILFGVALTMVAVTGITTWTRLVRDGYLATLRLLDGVAYTLRPLLARLGVANLGRLGAAGRGALVGGLLVTFFGTLFITSDRVFAQLVFTSLDVDLNLLPIRLIVALGILAGIGALVLCGPLVNRGWWMPSLVRAFARNPQGFGTSSHARRRLVRTEWVTALALLDCLFLAFVIVQITVLFGGERHVLDTAGLSYAEYARSGFFQLCAVGVGALVVTGVAASWASPSSTADRIWLRVLLGLLLILTGVVLLSAVRRLSLYEATYGYTRLRLAVHATILWTAGIIALVLGAGFKLRGKWLPTAVLTFTAVGLLLFTAINPDALIARRNIQRHEDTGKIDLNYLSILSADAATEMTKLPVSLRDCVLLGLSSRIEDRESWVSFNMARSSARRILDAVEPDSLSCSSFGRD
jgi:hypothetical protein